jgi:hypothetical protein
LHGALGAKRTETLKAEGVVLTETQAIREVLEL